MINELIDACKIGDLKKTKLIIQKNENYINDSYFYEFPFTWACEYGHLEVAQYLLEVNPNINILANDSCAFTYSCANGYLHVAEWLLKLKPNIDICYKNNYAFKYICKNNYLHAAQWLQRLKPFKYYIKIKNNNIIDNTINNINKENLLATLYIVSYNNYNLLSDVVINISKYM